MVKWALIVAMLMAGTAVAQQPWKPTPYSGKIVPGYKGENAVRFYQVFANSAARNKKGEFETTAAYDARTSDVNAIIAPIDTQARYAFELGTTATYDADRQVYRVGYKDAYHCGLASLQNLQAKTVLCKIAEQSISSDDYVGQNAFGATRQVSRIRGQKVSLTFPRDIVERADLFTRIDTIGNYSLVHDVSVPLDKAVTLRGKDVDVLLVGRITGSKLVPGRGDYTSPTIDNPLDIIVNEVALPFQPTSIVFYVVETGEILEEISL